MKRAKEERARVLGRELRAFVKSTIPYWFAMKTGASPKRFSKLSDGDLILPHKDEISQLDHLARDLASLIRKKTPGDLLRCYKVADREDKGLRLFARIEAAITRWKKVPPRPLEVIARFMSEPGDIGLAAKKFFKITLPIRKGKADPGTVEWEEFEDLLRRYRNAYLERTGAQSQTLLTPRARKAPGGPQLVAYCVYLEIEFEDRIWWSTYGEADLGFRNWINGKLGDPVLASKVAPLFTPPLPASDYEQRIAEERLNRRRAGARNRKRRERAKKSAQKA